MELFHTSPEKITKMQIQNVKPNTPEWLAYRREHFCASDAAAMLGLSPHKTRDVVQKLHPGPWQTSGELQTEGFYTAEDFEQREARQVESDQTAKLLGRKFSPNYFRLKL